MPQISSEKTFKNVKENKEVNGERKKAIKMREENNKVKRQIETTEMKKVESKT